LVNDWLQQRKLLTINPPGRASGRRHQPLTIKFITTPNPEMIVAAQSDPEFLKALQSADLAIPDGVGIIWGLNYLSLRGAQRRGNLGLQSDRRDPAERDLAMTSLQRVSGLELMESLIIEATKNGWKVMLLGGKPGVGEKATAALRRNFKFQISNFKLQALAGPVDIDKATPVQVNNLINSINSFSPDLLFVAFGHGKQEKWLNVNRYRLNVGVAMGVGGAFDQIADPSLRPPEFINKLGMGWLYRLFREPWRWKRQLSLVRFIQLVIIRALEH
jgi:N-acetylglucosaminyldiphosphoundecaprenol N-acetyl-beta-D-mannosaminyltransferase